MFSDAKMRADAKIRGSSKNGLTAAGENAKGLGDKRTWDMMNSPTTEGMPKI
jgi:hypothetical protein